MNPDEATHQPTPISSHLASSPPAQQHSTHSLPKDRNTHPIRSDTGVGIPPTHMTKQNINNCVRYEDKPAMAAF